MPRVSRRNRTKNKSNDSQNMPFQPGEKVTVNKTKILTPIYDAAQYIKNDLKWSVITTAIVVVVLIIAFILLR
jgi:hypothetical protein